MIGQVLKVIAGFFDVESEQKIYRLRASGSLREQKIIPIVGDYVEFNPDGILLNVLDRQNVLIRPKVANVDQVAIVCALDEPKFSSLLLDRFLAIIESQNLDVIILFTKADRFDHQPFYDYQSQNYQCFLIDNNQDWIDQKLINLLTSKLTVFTGQSGVGKSTTINKLLKLNLKTNAISKALGRGKHTTRVVEIHHINNIKIIDTPGFGSIKVSLTKQELATSFKDFKIWAKQCKFRSCLHYKENDCFVKQQLNEKKLLQQRYDNYLKILLNDLDENKY